jgi:hypothetical protein
MRNEGFLETLLNIVKHSLAFGFLFIVITVLIGIMKNTSGASYFTSMLLMFIVFLSAFTYAKRNFYAQRN